MTSATLLENALVSGSESDTTVTIDGREVDIFINSVGPHYLETMGIRLVAGRPLLASDTAGAPPVVVINETAARQFFARRVADRRPHHVRARRELEVVGVAADSKYDGLRNAVEPTMLQSYLQLPTGSMTVAVRSSIRAGRAARSAIDAAVHEVDPSLPMTGYQTQVGADRRDHRQGTCVHAAADGLRRLRAAARLRRPARRDVVLGGAPDH